jgi:fermentation-respiration switch protein FrsA (DUF1100 family)
VLAKPGGMWQGAPAMKKLRNWRRATFAALLGLALIFMLLRWFENSQVYHPGRTMDASGAELKRPFESVFFKSTDGVELNGWFYPADPNSAHAKIAVLVCHGNAGNISDRLELYRPLLAAGAAVFAFDYRGFGLSQGRPSEEGTYRDAQAAYRWLRQKGLAGSNIIAYGESLGGGIASELCLREEIAGLILQSTFTSIPDVGAELYPWLPVKLISTIKYDTRSKLPKLKIPVLVMHSREDNVIEFDHSQRNLAAANEPKFFCELTGEHNGLAWSTPEFRAAIEKFLDVVQESKRK